MGLKLVYKLLTNSLLNFAIDWIHTYLQSPWTMSGSSPLWPLLYCIKVEFMVKSFKHRCLVFYRCFIDKTVPSKFSIEFPDACTSTSRKRDRILHQFLFFKSALSTLIWKSYLLLLLKSKAPSKSFSN
jgi:hypothetical protein